MSLASTPDNPAPPGAIEDAIRAADGVGLRTARWAPAGAARGTVALFGGRAEFIEKYFEVARDLVARGFAVAALDWRGQGGSDRPHRDARRGHVDDFAEFERDLDAFVSRVLAPHCPRPWIGLGHSMAATILLAADAHGASPFERLVLTSPMIAVKGINHRKSGRLVVGALARLGLGRAFAPRSARETFWTRPFEGNVFTTDPVRFARIAALARSAPHLFLGGPTVGWARAAFRAMRSLDDPRAAGLGRTPTLIVASGADRVTDFAAAERFAARLAQCRFVGIEGAEHEILIERDALREQFWAAFDAFVTDRPAEAPRLAATL